MNCAARAASVWLQPCDDLTDRTRIPPARRLRAVYCLLIVGLDGNLVEPRGILENLGEVSRIFSIAFPRVYKDPELLERDGENRELIEN